MLLTSSMSNLKSSLIPNSSPEVRETNLRSNNQFLINLGFMNPSAPLNEPKRKIRNDKESVEKKDVRNVRKSSRLVAEADEKKEQSRLENEEEESVCLYCFDKYNDGTTYSFRGLIRHQNSGLCARNKLNSAGSKLIAINKKSVVMSNRSKHLSDNFKTRQVFNVVGENLSIKQPFDDVNVDDDVNMEIA